MSETEEVKPEMSLENERFNLSVPREKVEPLENADSGMSNPVVLTSRVATEHNYAKLMPFRSSHCSGKEASFPTVVLFPDRVKGKLRKKKKKHIKSTMKGKPTTDDAPISMAEEISSENQASNSVLSDSLMQPSIEGECNR